MSDERTHRKQRLAANDFGKIAARSQQRFGERGAAEFLQINECVSALVARGTVAAATFMQEEIFAAERRDAGGRDAQSGQRHDRHTFRAWRR